ncbi:MAG: DNA polymerase III subunit alpha, partial [Alphaproteobacteria bacterium]|nr:DNA polymerase III subunit alpha [Alphaproteobacteria bacterium]
MAADFIHLAVHSAYSLSEGAIKTKQLIELAKREGMPALGVADTGNLFGALEFALAASEQGVQPIIGCRLAIRRADGGMRGGKPPLPDRMTLIAQSEAGWLNLMHLVSRAFLDTDGAETPQVPMALVEAHAEGLIALSGGPGGPIGRMLVDGQAPAADAMAERLAKAFPGRLYIELHRHGLEPEARIEPALLDIAYQRDLPLVAVNEAFFPDAKMYEAHDALLCIASGRFVAETDRPRLTPEHRFKSAAEMRALFADLPEAADNTVVIAQRVGFMPRSRKPILPVPPMARGKSAEEAMRETAMAGLEERLVKTVYTPEMDEGARTAAAKPYRERLAYEVDVIIKMGFAGYFLIVADFIRWAKAQSIPVGPGRGSGAGSVVAWALTITDLDPLRFALLFERFLNPERVSMPDFDIDFCQERRDEVIEYVAKEYGRDRVAQIITFGKLQARAVLRNVGRVLGMPYGQVDKICKLVPHNPAKPVTLQQAIDGETQLQEMRRSDEAVGRLIDISLALEGLYRNASTHAAGVVIGDRPLDQLVPLYRDPRSAMPATQFNLKYVELAGLVKFDFLGLKTLTVLDLAVKLLKRRGIELDLAALPLDDLATYQLLSKAEAVGVFQLEGTGMRDAMRRLKPDRFEDIIALVALYRPGPMENIPRYIACKHGEETPEYLHPKLEPILKETFGVIVYQEQVMQIAQVLAGYSLGGADLLRRAMGKKIRAEMEAQRDVFVKGAMEQGVEKAQAAQIFDLLAKFADYGFNKSHAAAYALVAYHTAWFKANHPVEFIAASMSLDLDNTDKLNVFRQELDRLGIKLLPPDINRSEARFSVEIAPGEARGKVRYALAALKGVGAAAMDALVAERAKNGPFRSLADFARRIDAKQINRSQLESLVKAGAFDSIESNRARLFAAIETILKTAQRCAEERESSQVNLFGGAQAETPIKLPAIPDWPTFERLGHELSAIGFYLSAHPLDAYAKGLARLGVVRSNEIAARLASGGSPRVKLAGTVIGRQERTTAKGSRMAFVQMSDAGGMFEMLVFSETLATARDLFTSGKPLLVTVNARIEEESLRMVADAVTALDDAVASAAAGLKVTVRDPSCLDQLKAIIAGERRGR